MTLIHPKSGGSLREADLPHLQADCAAIEARPAVDRAPIGGALQPIPDGPARD